MPYFDRFDICEAYAVAEWLWHDGGWLRERASNRRRREATSIQLARMHFRPAPSIGSPDDLTENGREIYDALMRRYGFAEEAAA